jgi:hypothetical protein
MRNVEIVLFPPSPPARKASYVLFADLCKLFYMNEASMRLVVSSQDMYKLQDLTNIAN